MGKKSHEKRDKVHFDLKQPCPTCPFRKDVPYDYEYGQLMKNVMNMIDNMNGHTCHYTDPDADLPSNAVTNVKAKRKQHCFGSLMMMRRSGSFNGFPMCMNWRDIAKVKPRIAACNVDVYSLPELILASWEDMKVHDPELFEELNIQSKLDEFMPTFMNVGRNK